MGSALGNGLALTRQQWRGATITPPTGAAAIYAASVGLWQDTARTVPAGVNDPVGCWDDQSGNGRNWTQATAGIRPAVALTGALKRVDFSGGKWLTAGTALSAACPTAGTIAFRYFDPNPDKFTEWTTLNTISVSDQRTRYAPDGGSYPCILRSHRVGSILASPLGDVTVTYRSSDAGWSRRDNGTTAVTAGALYSGGDEWRLGWEPATQFLGPVMGMAVYGRVLTDVECQQVEAWLASL